MNGILARLALNLHSTPYSVGQSPLFLQVDGVFQHLPVNLLSGQLRIFQHGLSITIDSTFGFALTYDLYSHVRVTIPSIYQDHVGGLCGNYNGDQSDDLQLPDGTVVTDENEFGAAWKIPVVGVPCTDGCGAEGCSVCAEEKKEAFKQPSSCGLLTTSNGPFSACHAIVNPEPYLNNCINDLCVGGGDQQILCQSLQSYMKACQEARVTIEPWRSATFCREYQENLDSAFPSFQWWLVPTETGKAQGKETRSKWCLRQ